MTQAEFVTALVQDLQLRGVPFERSDVLTFAADVWSVAQDDPGPGRWAVKFLERRAVAKWLRVLRTTYLVVLSFLAFFVGFVSILTIALVHKPMCAHVLIGLWRIPGLYCFVDVLRANPPPRVPVQGNERLKSRSLLTGVVVLPVVFLMMLEMGPLFLWYRERDGWFKDWWVRIGLQACLFLFLVAGFALLFLEDRYTPNGSAVVTLLRRLLTWLGF